MPDSGRKPMTRSGEREEPGALLILIGMRMGLGALVGIGGLATAESTEQAIIAMFGSVGLALLLLAYFAQVRFFPKAYAAFTLLSLTFGLAGVAKGDEAYILGRYSWDILISTYLLASKRVARVFGN